MTSKSAVDAFKNLDDLVHLDAYYFWLEWKFWILFKTDVRFTFSDKKKILNADSPVTINENKLDRDEYTVDVLKDGAKSVTIKSAIIDKYAKEGERIKIAMQPSEALAATSSSTPSAAIQQMTSPALWIKIVTGIAIFAAVIAFGAWVGYLKIKKRS